MEKQNAKDAGTLHGNLLRHIRAEQQWHRDQIIRGVSSLGISKAARSLAWHLAGVALLEHPGYPTIPSTFLQRFPGSLKCIQEANSSVEFWQFFEFGLTNPMFKTIPRPSQKMIMHTL